MRISIDIKQQALASIQQFTAQSDDSRVIEEALREYIQLKTAIFLTKVVNGQTDYQMSNDEIEALFNFERI